MSSALLWQGPQLDTSDWPQWAVSILLAILLLDRLLNSRVGELAKGFFSHRAVRQTDRDEFQQALEKQAAEAQLKQIDRQQQRASWREEQVAELLHEDQRWIRERLAADLDSIRGLLDAQRHLMARMMDTLAVIYTTLAKTNGSWITDEPERDDG